MALSGTRTSRSSWSPEGFRNIWTVTSLGMSCAAEIDGIAAISPKMAVQTRITCVSSSLLDCRFPLRVVSQDRGKRDEAHPVGLEHPLLEVDRVDHGLRQLGKVRRQGVHVDSYAAAAAASDHAIHSDAVMIALAAYENMVRMHLDPVAKGHDAERLFHGLLHRSLRIELLRGRGWCLDAFCAQLPRQLRVACPEDLG